MTYWDTIEIDRSVTLGTHRFTADEIKAFAAKFDPQAFHLDEAAARTSLLGALCASGWHTAAVFMRLNVEHVEAEMKRWAAAGRTAPELGPSPGFRNMKWPLPVFAGDTVTYSRRITNKRLLTRRPGWGLLASSNVGVNQNGRTVFSFDGAVFLGLQ